MNESAAAAPDAAASTSPSGSARPTLLGLIASFAGASGARLGLFEAEAQRAGWAIVYMGAMAVVASLLLVTAWLVIAGSLVYAAATSGIPWWIGAVAVVAAHLIGAYVLLQRVHQQVDRISFAGTRRSIVSAFKRPAQE